MGVLDKLLGKRCGICHKRLDFGAKAGMSVGSGAGGFEALMSARQSQMMRRAYKCKSCGRLVCYGCGRNGRCPKCGKKRFELATE